jgi:SAM-dependent methyltransferase
MTEFADFPCSIIKILGMLTKVRSCPLCGGANGFKGFPYSVRFKGARFEYWECVNCCTVYVDPIPDETVFALMYSKKDYHDAFYSSSNSPRIQRSINILGKWAPNNGTILDYGCGVGEFLQLAKLEGFIPTGVEFNREVALQASERVCCTVYTPEIFFSESAGVKFDLIHMGDVLEHLPNPRLVVEKLIKFIKPGGVLFVEGPLETNPSLVYFASVLFGSLKKRFASDCVGDGVPHHLYRTDAESQRSFFHRIDSRLKLVEWEIYESGWPYADGGFVKKVIARAAMRMGGHSIMRITFGNRFRGVFILEA